MLPTFVIGLREGLEAALIVGIIAAFLRKQGRLDLLRWVYVGVATAIALCVAVGVALRVLSHDLPQRQQEGLETVVGVLAVGMVTYMVVWMRRHSRDLRGALEGATAEALSGGSDRAGRALVVMAFLAVLREGFETVVFLLAAFNETGSGASPVAGAILGILVAIGLGWGIYRGGVRLNLSKFFRGTGLVLVVVAAGLVMTALHTAHEAGWLDLGQRHTLDLSWLVRPGSVRASLLTGILGLQSQPVVVELVGWLAYLVPVAMYVGWPQERQVSPRRLAIAATASSSVAAIAAGVLLLACPAKPAGHPITSVGKSSFRVVSQGTGAITIRMPTESLGAPVANIVLTRLQGAPIVRDGLSVDRYVLPSVLMPPLPSRMLSASAVAQLNGGRLPLGLMASRDKIGVEYRGERSVSVDIAAGPSARVVAATWMRQTTATAQASFGEVQLSRPVSSSSASLPATAVTAAVAAARHDQSAVDRRRSFRETAVWLAAMAVALLAGAGCSAAVGRRGLTHPLAFGLDGDKDSLLERQVSLT
ncbi:MAG TPA: iron uptake transporter permease EfeU [Mycobacteriales bacterium]|jgi:high-affinity iron transporter|nr:iron uptake transporter permease EfeU [Mycobacteriales bacterium]